MTTCSLNWNRFKNLHQLAEKLSKLRMLFGFWKVWTKTTMLFRIGLPIYWALVGGPFTSLSIHPTKSYITIFIFHPINWHIPHKTSRPSSPITIITSNCLAHLAPLCRRYHNHDVIISYLRGPILTIVYYRHHLVAFQLSLSSQFNVKISNLKCPIPYRYIPLSSSPFDNCCHQKITIVDKKFFVLQWWW